MQENSRSLSNKIEQRVKMPSLAFFICLGISVLIWCFLTFSREYEVMLDYSITCSDLPEGKSTATCSDPTIALKFKAKGFAYLNPNFKKTNRHLNLSMKKLSIHKGLGLNTYRFTKNELTDYIRDTENISEYFIAVESPYEITIYLDN